MKLIIYWLTLMVILPLCYLFWWKKTWRLFLGIVILITLTVGWLLPGKLAFSMAEKELKKIEEKEKKENWIDKRKGEKGRPWQKMEEALKNAVQQEANSQNQEKIVVEKEILRLREEGKRINQEEAEAKEKEREYYRNQHLPEWQGKGEEIRKKYLEALKKSIKSSYLLEQKEWEWVVKWGGKTDSPVLLFCGEEFNYELLKVRTTFKGSWQLVYNRDWASNVINFDKYGNSKPQFLREKIREIYQQSQNQIDMDYKQSEHSVGENNILFKNIDKITDPDLINELSLVLNPAKNKNLGNYQKKLGKNDTVEATVDLSRFLLITTTSNSRPKLSEKLRTKLKHVEPFLDKHFWIIFLAAGGSEIIIFFLIRRSKKKKIGLGKN